MIIVRLLSPGPWLVGTTKVYPGVGADIVMESITLIDQVNEGLDYCLLKTPRPMTNAERNRLSAVIRATEYLFLENIAPKLVLEHRAVPNWQRLLERLLDDKEMLAGVRLKFRDLYGQLAGTADPSGALDALLAELPAPKKPQIGRASWRERV